MKLIKTLFLFLFISSSSFSQVHCGSVQIDPNNTDEAFMVFDNFTKYNAGITLQTVARVRVVVEDKAVVDPLCSWSLRMFVDNNSGVGTPLTEWEQIALYGNGNGQNPLISALQIRVRNACSTSPSNGVFRNFTDVTDILDIIEPLLPVTPAGSCTQNVNGSGSYLTNYDEFNFDIDVRLNPNFNFNPGIFKLNIRFRLEENL